MRATRAIVVACLLAATGAAGAEPAASPFQRPVGAHVLAGVRGGFTTPGGGTLAIAVDIHRTTPVVVQNGIDNRHLQTLTTIDVRTTALRTLNGLALQASVGAAIAHSLQR